MKTELAMVDGLPKTHHEKSFNFLGLFKFYHLVEDRRPDLCAYHVDDYAKIKELGYKYKHIFDIQFLWFFNYHVIIKSVNPGIIWDKNEEI